VLKPGRFLDLMLKQEYDDLEFCLEHSGDGDRGGEPCATNASGLGAMKFGESRNPG